MPDAKAIKHQEAHLALLAPAPRQQGYSAGTKIVIALTVITMVGGTTFLALHLTHNVGRAQYFLSVQMPDFLKRTLTTGELKMWHVVAASVAVCVIIGAVIYRANRKMDRYKNERDEQYRVQLQQLENQLKADKAAQPDKANSLRSTPVEFRGELIAQNVEDQKLYAQLQTLYPQLAEAETSLGAEQIVYQKFLKKSNLQGLQNTLGSDKSALDALEKDVKTKEDELTKAREDLVSIQEELRPLLDHETPTAKAKKNELQQHLDIIDKNVKDLAEDGTIRKKIAELKLTIKALEEELEPLEVSNKAYLVKIDKLTAIRDGIQEQIDALELKRLEMSFLREVRGLAPRILGKNQLDELASNHITSKTEHLVRTLNRLKREYKSMNMEQIRLEYRALKERASQGYTDADRALDQELRSQLDRWEFLNESIIDTKKALRKWTRQKNESLEAATDRIIASQEALVAGLDPHTPNPFAFRNPLGINAANPREAVDAVVDKFKQSRAGQVVAQSAGLIPELTREFAAEQISRALLEGRKGLGKGHPDKDAINVSDLGIKDPLNSDDTLEDNVAAIQILRAFEAEKDLHALQTVIDAYSERYVGNKELLQLYLNYRCLVADETKGLSHPETIRAIVALVEHAHTGGNKVAAVLHNNTEGLIKAFFAIVPGWLEFGNTVLQQALVQLPEAPKGADKPAAGAGAVQGAMPLESKEEDDDGALPKVKVNKQLAAYVKAYGPLILEYKDILIPLFMGSPLGAARAAANAAAPGAAGAAVGGAAAAAVPMLPPQMQVLLYGYLLKHLAKDPEELKQYIIAAQTPRPPGESARVVPDLDLRQIVTSWLRHPQPAAAGGDAPAAGPGPLQFLQQLAQGIAARLVPAGSSSDDDGGY